MLVLSTFGLTSNGIADSTDHTRDGWLVGFGFGFAYGEATFANDMAGDTRNGVNPQICLGHMLGKSISASLDYNGWVYEFGSVPDKFRVSMQNISAAITWYPGNPKGVSGGIFLRATGGLAWTSLAVIELDDDLIQDQWVREDELGLGLGLAFGYEMRITEEVASGLSVGYNYMDIGGDIFESGYYVPVALSLTWYWD